MTLTDEQVVTKVFENKENYQELVERYLEPLRRYVYYLTANEEATEDIIQETFIKVFVNLRSFNTKKKFSTWIYRIAHNEAVNYLRKKKFLWFGESSRDWSSNEDLVEDMEKKEVVEAVHKCLNSLPLKYKSVLTLYFLEEKTYEEISDILRVPMGTVATNISRGKKIMKSICKK